MNDKKALLGELSITDADRQIDGSSSKLVITGIGAVLLAVVAWLWLDPMSEPIVVSIVIAQAPTAGQTTPGDAVLDASGYVTARRQATVSSKFTGKVLEVYIEEGVVVEANQLLAKLDNSSQLAQLNLSIAQLKATESRLHEVQIQLQEAELELNRTLELANLKLASQADLDRTSLAVKRLQARIELIRAEINVADSTVKVQQQFLDDTEIRAPFAGVVIAKSAQPGEMISPVSAGGGFTRTGICTIVDMDSLEIEVDVNESYINRVMPEQQVSATLNSYPDWQIPAKVITIIPTADRSKATVRVRIALLEKSSKILPDMGVRVSFLEEKESIKDSEEQLTGVLIPDNAITTASNGPIVFVVVNNYVAVRSVQVGKKQGRFRNVILGLAIGESVVSHLDDDMIAALSDGQQVVVK